MTRIVEGDAMPDFSLPDADGRTVESTGLLGRPYVLFLYPKDDTSGCTSEAKAFSERAGAFAEADVAVFGVSPDTVASHARFRAKHVLDVRLLADEGRRLLEPLGVWVEKSMYGKRFMGVERTTVLVGADGRVTRVWPKVKVEGHADEVLAAARAIGSAPG